MERFASIVAKCRTAIVSAVSLAALIGSLIVVESVYSQTAPGSSPRTLPGDLSARWTMQSPLPAVRAEVAAVALDGELHALGGSFDGQAGTYHNVYDPARNEWRPAAPLPAPRDHLAVATANKKIYAFGGFAVDVRKEASNATFEYDPARTFPSTAITAI